MFIFLHISIYYINNNNGDHMNILITGAASNIGLALALKLSKHHYIYLTTHTIEQYQKLKSNIHNTNIECLKIDVNQDLDIIDHIDIDCLISCAAIGIGGSVLDMDIKYLKDNFNTNFFSQVELIQIVYIKMHQKGNGKIFITSSLAQFLSIPMLGNYCSSKAALSSIVTTMHKELKIIKTNITISLIEPGAYHTGFNQVMIDNKDKYLNKNGLFYKYKDLFAKKF